MAPQEPAPPPSDLRGPVFHNSLRRSSPGTPSPTTTRRSLRCPPRRRPPARRRRAPGGVVLGRHRVGQPLLRGAWSFLRVQCVPRVRGGLLGPRAAAGPPSCALYVSSISARERLRPANSQASSNETLEAVLLAYLESPMMVSTRVKTAWDYFTERYFCAARGHAVRDYHRIDERTPRRPTQP